MPAPKVRGDYDELSQIQKLFMQQAQACSATLRKIQAAKDTLQGGDWIGQGAKVFYREMDSEVLPSMKRQAIAMYNNIESQGVDAQKALYGPYGDQVIDVYVAEKAAGKSRDEIIAAMETKINDLGPSNVSRHLADPSVKNVIDIAPSSIADREAFEKAVEADSRVSKFLKPPADPAYHLEIPQPSSDSP